MPTRPKSHRLGSATQHRPSEPDRQARRLYATNDATWRKIRRAVLSREPLCRACREKGISRMATEVDHIDNDSHNNAPDNLQPLCKPCHSRKTAREMQRGQAGFEPARG